jgi:hypothetical protein
MRIILRIRWIILLILGIGFVYYFVTPQVIIDKRAILSKDELFKLEELVNAGDSNAAFKIANHYFTLGYKENVNAQKWLEKAASMGHIEAQNLLAERQK